MRVIYQAKIFIVLLFGLIFGIVLGRQSMKPAASKPSEPSAACAELENTQREMRQIGETEYQQYLALKDSPEKMQKANELLGKIMVLFLADIGTRLKAAEQTLKSPAPYVETPSAPAPTPIESAAKTPPQKPSPEAPTWKNAGTAIGAARREDEALEAMKKAEIDNLVQAIKSSTEPSQAQIASLNGVFSGEITFGEGREPWHMEFRLAAANRGEGVKGRHSLILSKGGKVFSNSSGRGDLDQYAAESAEEGSAIFIKAGGDLGYFQLYPVANLRAIVGIFYEKKGIDEFKPTGQVKLQRR